jgi:DNA-binding NtrC family response regulator
VPLLARRFASDLAAEWGRPTLTLTEGALAHLARRPWPGNVRELRNAIERAVILARRDVLDVVDVSEDPTPGAAVGEGFLLPSDGVRVEELMDDLVRQAMRRTDGNQSAAALVGLSRDQLRYRLQRLGLLGKAGAEESPA